MFAWVVETTLVVAALAGLAVLAGRRAAPALAHGLWLVALLKLLAPPLLAWPSWPPAEPAPIAAARPTTTQASRFLRITAAPAASIPIVAEAPIDWERWMVRAWVGSSLALMVWQVGRMVRFDRRLRRGEDAPSTLRAIAGEAADRIGARPPRIVLAEVAAPLLWCWGRPTIAVPVAWSKAGEELPRRAALGHELAHLARRDHWVAWLELAAWAVWWWNPLLWLVRRGLRDAADAACDARVVSAWPEARRLYAEVLIAACERSARPKAPAPALGLGSPGRHFRRRLAMIMTSKKSRPMSIRGRLALAALAALAFPAFSAGQAQPPEGAGGSASAPPPKAEAPKAPESLGTTRDQLTEARQRILSLEQELYRLEQELKGVESAEPTPATDRRAAAARSNIEVITKTLDELRVYEAEILKAVAEAMGAANPLDPPDDNASKSLDEFERRNGEAHAEAEKAYGEEKLSKPPIIEPGHLLRIEVDPAALPAANRLIQVNGRVRPDGTISLGYYGDLKVVGLNRIQIKERLVAHLRKYTADEALGLVRVRDGKMVVVAPADSDRVFVDDSQVESPPSGPEGGMTMSMSGGRGGMGGGAMTGMMPGSSGMGGRAGGMEGGSGAGRGSGGYGDMGGPGAMGGMMGGGGGAAPAAGAGDAAGGGGFSGGLGGDEPVRLPSPRFAADEKSQALKERLNTPIDVPFAEPTTLKDVAEYFSSALKPGEDAPGVDFYFDKVSLEEAGFTPDDEVTMSMKGVPAKLPLRLILREFGLTYGVKEGVILVGSPGVIEELMADDDDAAGR